MSAGTDSVPLGGTDPGADYSGAATLASVRLSRVAIGGYDQGEVEGLRKRALNTIAYLEAQVEALQVQLQSLRSVLETSGPEALGKGLVVLAKSLRASFGPDQGLELAWAAQELATIVSAPAEVSDEHASTFPAQLAQLARAGIGQDDARPR
jgi:hypothetical protein